MRLVHYALVSILIILAAADSPALLPNDPRRPVASIAADLGITADQFVFCFNSVTPAPQGSAPTDAQVHLRSIF
jgi:hypothetical protein